MISHSIGLAVASILALLPIANPLSTVGLFLSLTANESEEFRRKVAKRACINAFFILAVFFIAGRLIMEFFGISIPGLRIAGGIVVSRVALEMMASQMTVAPLSSPMHESTGKDDISFTPLAMPSISGPGAIAATIGLTSHITHPLDYVSILMGIFTLSMICYFVLAGASKGARYLSSSRLQAITKIMGFLILCIGVQFILNGIISLLEDPDVIQLLQRVVSCA